MTACPFCEQPSHAKACPALRKLLMAPEANPRAEAEHAAQNWANVADEAIYVISANDRYFIANKDDRACYHEDAIARGEARIVSVFWPRLPAFAEPALV